MNSEQGRSSGLARERMEELEEALSAARDVNAHLAQQIEALAMENDSLKRLLDAERAHLKAVLKRLKPPGEVGEEAALATTLPPQQHASIAQNNGDSARIQEWLVDSECIELGSVIGQGTFGATHRGIWQGIDVAIKIVSPSSDSMEVFLREATAMSMVRHANIVQLYGAVMEPPERCWLITELLEGGTLAQWLHGGPAGQHKQPRTLLQRLRAVLDVACGMQALEQHEPPILHRDLKPTNVLLDANGRCKVSDMGLARVLTPDALISLTPETGSYLYMAPEVVRHDLYATQADVWSWACLACETLSSMRPYAELHLTPVQVALSVAEGGQRPRIPVDCPPVVCELLEAALAFEPLDRPSFAVIAAVMRRVVEEEGSKEKAMKTMNLAGGSWKGWFGRPT